MNTHELVATVKQMNESEKDEMRDVLGPPSQGATDGVYLIVVAAVALVLLGSAAGVIFNLGSENNRDTLVTIFTAAITFMGGLLIKSPITK